MNTSPYIYFSARRAQFARSSATLLKTSRLVAGNCKDRSVFWDEIWNDEGVLTLSFLAANHEASQFTAGQLGNLVQTVIKR
jgi:hypothetical protein